MKNECETNLTAKSANECVERLWNIQEAAAFLGISIGTAYSWVSQKKLPLIRISARCIKFSPAELRRWVSEHSEKESPNGTNYLRR
jgi:excisionase family DNA binding protein